MKGSIGISEEMNDKNSIVDQTTDIINRFRNSIIRSRKERLFDEDIQATQNIVNQLHFTELITKETLGKLILQSDSIEKSYYLINQLEKEIKDIAQDLNEVNGKTSCFICSFKTFQKCFKKKKKITKKNNQQILLNQQNRLSFATEREDMLSKIRNLSKERRENPDFINLIKQLNEIKQTENETNENKLNKYRDYLLENHSLSYGYIDEPDRLINEINMSIHFTQLNTHLDNLLGITNIINNQINKHNLIISKIEKQAMESGNLLTDYTLLGNHILGSIPNNLQTFTNTNTIKPNLNTLAISTGEKILLNSVI